MTQTEEIRRQRLIKKSKLYVRVSGDDFDEEIKDLIDAAFVELKIGGVDAVDDPIIDRAVTVYVKAHFGHENPDREGLLEAFQNLRQHLATTREYSTNESSW